MSYRSCGWMPGLPGVAGVVCQLVLSSLVLAKPLTYQDWQLPYNETVPMDWSIGNPVYPNQQLAMSSVTNLGNCSNSLCLNLLYRISPHIILDHRINHQPYYNILTTLNNTVNNFHFRANQSIEAQLPGAGLVVQSNGFAAVGIYQQRYLPGLQQAHSFAPSSFIPAVFDMVEKKYIVLDKPHTFRPDSTSHYMAIARYRHNIQLAGQNTFYDKPPKGALQRPGTHATDLPPLSPSDDVDYLRFPMAMNEDGSGIQTVLGIEYDLDEETYRLGFWNKQSGGDFVFNYFQLDETDETLVDMIKEGFFPNVTSYSASLNLVLITWNNSNQAGDINQRTFATQCRMVDGQCTLKRLYPEGVNNVVGVMVNRDGTETAVYDMYSGLVALYLGDKLNKMIDPDTIGLAGLGNYCPMEVYQPGPETILTESVVFNSCGTSYIWDKARQRYRDAGDFAVKHHFKNSLKKNYQIEVSHSDDTRSGTFYYGSYSIQSPTSEQFIVVEEVDNP